MKYYALLFLAVIIGQTFVACVVVWVEQRKNRKLGYFKALKLYLEREVGSFMTILSFTAMVMFVMSDWMNLKLTKEDLLLKETLNKFEAAQVKFRTVAVCYGVFAQWIAWLFYKGGVHAIRNYGKTRGVDDIPDTPSLNQNEKP